MAVTRAVVEYSTSPRTDSSAGAARSRGVSAVVVPTMMVVLVGRRTMEGSSSSAGAGTGTGGGGLWAGRPGRRNRGARSRTSVAM